MSTENNETEQFETIGNPAPTEQPTIPERTDREMLREIFEQYPTEKEARKHINEVAAGKNKFSQLFGVSNCRKVISTACVFRGDKPRLEAYEPTARIAEAEEIEVIKEDETQPPYPNALDFETATQPPAMTYGYEAVKAELQPIQERSAKGIITNVFEIVGLKGEKGESLISDQESKDTIILLPYILKKITKTDMTQETFENLTIGMHVANIASKAIKNRMKKKKEEPVYQSPPQEPKQEPAAQTPPPEQTSNPETETSKPDADRNKPFLQALGKLKT